MICFKSAVKHIISLSEDLVQMDVSQSKHFKMSYVR